MSIEKAILPIKINELICLISERKRLDIKDAMHYLYSSAFYRRFTDKDSKWWYMSGLNLYKELEKEKKKLLTTQAKQEKEKLFLIFCLENYKEFKQMDITDVLALFLKHDVSGFIFNNYEVLHSQSEDYIMNEVETYIKNRQPK